MLWKSICFLLFLPALGAQTFALKKAGTHFLVDGVTVNGHGPFRFLLDTGAQTTVIDPRVAEQLGIRPSYRVTVVTVNGVRAVAGTKVTTVTLGRATAMESEVLWYGLEHVQKLDPVIAGILGQSFLRSFRYRIDNQNLLLDVEDEQRVTGLRLPLEWIHGCPAVRWQGRRMVLDSGSGALVLFRGKLPGAGLSQVADVETGAGRTRVLSRKVGILDFHGLGLKDVPAMLSPQSEREEDGLLPLSFFAAVTVDSRAGVVTFR